MNLKNTPPAPLKRGAKSGISKLKELFFYFLESVFEEKGLMFALWNSPLERG